MRWQSAIKDLMIPIITVLISGLAAYIGAKRGRTAALRQAIFAKQLEGASELYLTMTEFFVAATDEKITSSWERYITANQKWSIYFPNEIISSLAAFQGAARKKISQMNADSKTKREDEAQTIYDNVFNTYLESVSAIRRTIGVEALTSETAGLYGKEVGINR